MKKLVIVLMVIFVSGCSTINNDPEPCACGEMKEVNVVA
jgi:uncharacterized protein YceK